MDASAFAVAATTTRASACGARLLAALEVVDPIERVTGDLGHGAAEAFVGEHLAAGRGRASASAAMRVRVAAPTAAATERRQDLRVTASVEAGSWVRCRPAARVRLEFLRDR